MDRLGRIAVILVSLLLARACADKSATASSRPRPIDSATAAGKRFRGRSSGGTRSRLRPTFARRFCSSPRSKTGFWPRRARRPIPGCRSSSATPAQLPGQSSSPTSTPVGLRRHRHSTFDSRASRLRLRLATSRQSICGCSRSQLRAARADRFWLADQPRHGLASLRRPATDRGRGPGECLGGRGTAHAGQGPLGPHAERGRRLCPTRRRRPGF